MTGEHLGARLGISKTVSGRERLGWPPAWGKGARISGQNKKRSGAADLEIQQGSDAQGQRESARISRRSLPGELKSGQSRAPGETKIQLGRQQNAPEHHARQTIYCFGEGKNGGGNNARLCLANSGERRISKTSSGFKETNVIAQKYKFAASAAVCVKTGNFIERTAFEARPHWACRKRSFQGIPVPDVGRE